MPGPLPPACQKIATEIAALRAEVRDLQEELKHAPPQEKGQLAAQIKALLGQISQKEKQLWKCRGCPDNLLVGFPGSISMYFGTAPAPLGSTFVEVLGIGDEYKRGFAAIFSGCEPGHEHVRNDAG